jgi:hypothetical protein
MSNTYIKITYLMVLLNWLSFFILTYPPPYTRAHTHKHIYELSLISFSTRPYLCTNFPSFCLLNLHFISGISLILTSFGFVSQSCYLLLSTLVCFKIFYFLKQNWSMVYERFDRDHLLLISSCLRYFFYLGFLHFVRSSIKKKTFCIFCCFVVDLDDPHLLLNWIWILCIKKM